MLDGLVITWIESNGVYIYIQMYWCQNWLPWTKVVDTISIK